MGIFKSTQAEPAQEPEPQPAPAVAGPAKKQVPTPTRREAEEARRARLHPVLSPKEAKARDRAARNASRDEAMVRAEAQPGKVLMRDFIDSRRSIAPWSMPILMVTLMLSLLVSNFGTLVMSLVTWLTWGVLLAILVDLGLIWVRYKKLHAQRLPKEPLKGLMAYGINRAIQLRRLRVPAARVKPGDAF